MRRFIIKSIVLTLFVSTLGQSFVAASTSNESQELANQIAEEIDVKEMEQEIVEELEMDEFGNVDVSIDNIFEDTVEIESEVETEEINANTDIDIHVNTGELTVSGMIEDQNGNIVEETFDVFVQEVNGDDFVATFVNPETKEEYEIDTTKVQASVLPAVYVYIIVRMGLSYAIKTLGKKAIQGYITGYTKHGLAQAIGRDGGRGVATWAINSAIKNPTKIISQAGGVLRYENSYAVVVLNKYGKVITTWAKTSSAWR